MGDSIEKALELYNSTKKRAIQRAGIANAMHNLCGVSADTSSRSPIAAPWSIYPFVPEDCAALICDLLIFETTLSSEYLVNCLTDSGLTVELLLRPESGQLEPGQDILRARWRDRGITIHAPALNLLLYELAQPDAWAQGIAEALSASNRSAEPVLVFANAAEVWSPLG